MTVNAISPLITTRMEVGFVRRDETIIMPCGAPLTVADFELGPEPGEVTLFAAPAFDGLRGDRYIFASGEVLVDVVGSHRMRG